MAAPMKRQRWHSQDGDGGVRVEVGFALFWLYLTWPLQPYRNTIFQGSLKAEILGLEYSSSVRMAGILLVYFPCPPCIFSI